MRNRTSTSRLIRAIAVALTAIVICGILYVGITAVLKTRFGDPKETNTQAVERLLRFVQENPVGPFPKERLTSGNQNAGIELSLADDPTCWAFLQDAIARNSSQYSLVTYENGPPQPRDVDDSIVQIDFADGGRVKMVFYQSNLVACEIASKTN
jgi:hypothetical protein